ncbi:hypothetical protein ACQPXB_02540 [Amycolatopsis sp. CA-161197]|uniref:hypothetical protein n=1 Tax=Amycolatopsis sp. CA-161197 TaxID=3239922 RepID=UPI003D91A794
MNRDFGEFDGSAGPDRSGHSSASTGSGSGSGRDFDYDSHPDLGSDADTSSAPTSDTDVRALFSTLPDGPPLTLSAADVINDGARIRRRRKRLAVAGSSVATAAVLVVAGLAVSFAAGHHGPTAPVQPAGPGLSTIAPTPPPSSSLPTAPPTADTTARPPGAPTPSRSAVQAPGQPPASLPSSPRTPVRLPPSATTIPTHASAPPIATTR